MRHLFSEGSETWATTPQGPFLGGRFRHMFPRGPGFPPGLVGEGLGVSPSCFQAFGKLPKFFWPF